MADLSTNISIITLNVDGLNAPDVDRDQQSELKSMTQPYAVCKKLTSIIMLQAG